MESSLEAKVSAAKGQLQKGTMYILRRDRSNLLDDVGYTDAWNGHKPPFGRRHYHCLPSIAPRLSDTLSLASLIRLQDDRICFESENMCPNIEIPSFVSAP